MDKGTIIGVLAGVGLIVSSILLGGSLSTFWSTSSALIVGGGTVAALGIAFPTRELKLVSKVMRRVFRDPGDEAANIIKFLILALEGLAAKAEASHHVYRKCFPWNRGEMDKPTHQDPYSVA